MNTELKNNGEPYVSPEIKLTIMKTSEGVSGGEQPTVLTYLEFVAVTGSKYFRDYRRYLCSFDNGEVNNEPSMVEITHNLSLEQIMKDYSRGIVHSEISRSAYYDDDDGDDFDSPAPLIDFVDFMPTAGTPSAPRPSDDDRANDDDGANDDAGGKSGERGKSERGGSDESSAPTP